MLSSATQASLYIMLRRKINRAAQMMTVPLRHFPFQSFDFSPVTAYIGSLALAGAIRPDDPTLPPVRFFVGGSWPNAIISPLATIPAPQ